MIEINVNKNIIEKAKKRLSKINKDNLIPSKFGYNQNRILEGYIGEEIIRDYLGIKITEDKFDYDLISKKNKKLEVKTVSCISKPKSHYLCTVNSHSEEYTHKQKADFYIFVRLLKNYKTAWLVGWINCKDFFLEGKFVKKGKDFGNFKFIKANAYVLEINKLNKITS